MTFLWVYYQSSHLIMRSLVLLLLLSAKQMLYGTFWASTTLTTQTSQHMYQNCLHQTKMTESTIMTVMLMTLPSKIVIVASSGVRLTPVDKHLDY